MFLLLSFVPMLDARNCNPRAFRLVTLHTNTLSHRENIAPESKRNESAAFPCDHHRHHHQSHSHKSHTHIEGDRRVRGKSGWTTTRCKPFFFTREALIKTHRREFHTPNRPMKIIPVTLFVRCPPLSETKSQGIDFRSRIVCHYRPSPTGNR